MRKIALFWRLLLLCSLLGSSAYLRAADIEIRDARLENSDDGIRLAAAFNFELNPRLDEAIKRGIPLYFVTEVELTRPRWYWLDQKSTFAAQTTRLSYNILARTYRVTDGGLQQNFAQLEDALSLLRRPRRWLVAEKPTLKADTDYQVRFRMRLDVSKLPKPFQVNALNNSDWQLSSDWKSFGFRIDDK